MKSKSAKLIMVTVLASLLVLASACSKKDEGNNAQQPNKQETGTKENDTNKGVDKVVDPMGKIDPEIEVTAIRTLEPTTKFENGETIENNAWTKLYENEFGIKLKYLWVSDPTQFEQKFNIAMASGQLADIMPVNGIQFNQLVEADQLADLTDVLEKYGTPQTKEMLKKDGGVGLDSATYNGKLLGIPVNMGSFDTASLLWVRTDWLKKLNLPEPKTMADVFKIAEAFVTQDPDGNNKKDTQGLGATKEVYGLEPGLDGFFNGYHAYPKSWVADASGKLVYGSIQPEMKKALEKLQEMYKTGFIDREFGVKDKEKFIQTVNAGKLGMFYGADWSPLLFLDGKALDEKMEWKPFLLPSIDDQKAKAQTAYNVNQYYVVRKGMKHPEAVVKLLNAASYQWDRSKYPLTDMNRNGDVDKWQYALVQASNPIQNVELYEHVKNALEKKDESLLDVVSNPGQATFYKNINDFNNGDKKGWGFTRFFDAITLLYDYHVNDGFKLTEFTSGPTPTMVEKQATLLKMELETFTKIIMGESSIDSFDEFVSNWKKLGGDTITEEVAKWKASK
ncbi:lipoprotein LipO [Paenibacillus baekrokdamisoli]|uniref:Lipoprotein LipO n=1 Tax=Paenibacillus baekrokdamisoli TaxID=1712516 RepID=A0A3G9ISC5_9BACL|nr:extracellular solute-binding protein [Paenibacillus baekrokdamisoli]MBB3069170.1 putative aldouronate transport system substrate-binding protein [Paenibacillus baekrokdamisoli]BBH18855.1 lipoprotein LipO [Paenibacillus baekrokdamisoli]